LAGKLTLNMWLYNDQPFEDAPDKIFGFVYLITNIQTQRKYIGKKQFWSNRSKKVPGKKNRKHTIKESDWKTYWSSSEDIKSEVKEFGEDKFKKEILELCITKGDLTYAEVSHQIKKDVLKSMLPDGSREYYNKNILNRWFVK